MGNDYREHEGAVFFVDLLGFGALTKSEIPLKNDDYFDWGGDDMPEKKPQFLAAALLTQFRDILLEVRDDNRFVRFSQLSDCAFIWSSDCEEVVIAAAKVMHRAFQGGLLLRGGMAYGELIETSESNYLGRFIVGSAVTEAVKLEGLAKGARILVNTALLKRLEEDDNDGFDYKTSPLFGSLTNPLTFDDYNEFKWYLVYDLNQPVKDYNSLTFTKRVDYTRQRLVYAITLWSSQSYSWNARTAAGRAQLRASIRLLCENNCLGIKHAFDWRILKDLSTVSKRKQPYPAKAWDIVNSDETYQEFKEH